MSAAHAYDDTDNLKLIAEADSRGRLTLGKAGAKPGRQYKVETSPDGVIVLTPIVWIPEREMIVWENPELAAQILEGIEDAKAGRTHYLGSFAQYLTDEDDDE